MVYSFTLQTCCFDMGEGAEDSAYLTPTRHCWASPGIEVVQISAKVFSRLLLLSDLQAVQLLAEVEVNLSVGAISDRKNARHSSFILLRACTNGGMAITCLTVGKAKKEKARK